VTVGVIREVVGNFFAPASESRQSGAPPVILLAQPVSPAPRRPCYAECINAQTQK
jgi:hypothetical protein